MAGSEANAPAEKSPVESAAADMAGWSARVCSPTMATRYQLDPLAVSCFSLAVNAEPSA